MLKLLMKLINAPVKTTMATATDYVIAIIGGQISKIKHSDFWQTFLVNGKIPTTYLPGAVDELIEGYYFEGAFYEEVGHTTEITPATDKMYLDITTTDGLTYRWGGTQYAPIGNGLSLGETSTTAGRGDWNKAAYDFSQAVIVGDIEDLDTISKGFFTVDDIEYPIQFDEGIDLYGGYSISDNPVIASAGFVSQVAYTSNGTYTRHNDGAWSDWVKATDASDIAGFIKQATVKFLKTTELTAYGEVNNVLTATSNGVLTLDGGQTPVNGQTMFYQYGATNRCFTITDKGSVSTPWVLTQLLPNGVSTNPLLITTSPVSFWQYANSVYNRIYTKAESDVLLATKVDKITSYTLLSPAQASKIETSAQEIYVDYAMTETFDDFSSCEITDGKIQSTVNIKLQIDGIDATVGQVFFTNKETDDFFNAFNGLLEVEQAGSVSTPYIVKKYSIPHPRFVEVSNMSTEAGTYEMIGKNDDSYKYKNVNQKCYAEIYFADASTSQSIPTGATYTKIIAFTNNGLYENCTPNAANDKIDITVIGRYRVDGSFSSYAGTNSITLRTSIFLDGVEQSKIHTIRKFGTATDISTGSFSGFIDVQTVPASIDVRVRHDNGSSVDLTTVYGNLNVEKID